MSSSAHRHSNVVPLHCPCLQVNVFESPRNKSHMYDSGKGPSVWESIIARWVTVISVAFGEVKTDWPEHDNAVCLRLVSKHS
jgi:hypothetical protein